MKKLLQSILMVMTLFAVSAQAKTAQEHLATFGLTNEDARQFILSTMDNLPLIYSVCQQYGVNNDMLAEILATDFPGLTGQGVSGFFIMNGLDGAALGFTALTGEEQATWILNITGRISTNGLSAPVTGVPPITINENLVPKTTEMQGHLEESISQTYPNGSFTYTLQSSSDTEVVWRLEGTGTSTQSGFTINYTYDLIYTYTKQ